MKIINTKIDGLVIIEPSVFSDDRGYFFEPYNKSLFDLKIKKTNFIQDNESKSSRGVLRGFHFQKPPYDQAKLVRCIKGEVLDVAVDLRKKSNSFGKYKKVVLSEINKRQLFIPRGFAHAFLVLSKEAIVSYKVDNQYKPEFDSGIIWKDNTLNIDWNFPNEQLIISEKDKNLGSFNSLHSPF